MNVLAWVDLVVGLIIMADALVVLRRRPRHPIGLLLLLVALTWFAGDFAPALLFLHRGPMVHLHLSYPTGRVRRASAWMAICGGYVAAVFDGFVSAPWLTAAVAILLAGAALDTYAVSQGPARHAGAPALIAALLFSGALALSAANQLLYWGADQAVALTYDLVLAVVATWLAVDLLRGRWTEATIGQLIAQLSARPDDALEDTLRRATGDPSLRVAVGTAVTPPGQVATPVEDRGRTIATLLHDPRLEGDPVLIAGAVEATRLAVASGRMRHEIAERAAALADVRRRLVQAGEAQRRIVASSIADGPARSLQQAATAIRRADETPERKRFLTAIDDALAELDRFSRGLLPMPDGGIEQALTRLQATSAVPLAVRVAPVALSESVASTVWFVCAEAVTNAVKHASASRITVDVASVAGGVRVQVADDGCGGADAGGSGLHGLADRVATLGGYLEVHSEPGEGTTLVATIPADGENTA